MQPVFDRFVALLDKSGDNGKAVLADVESLIEKYDNDPRCKASKEAAAAMNKTN